MTDFILTHYAYWATFILTVIGLYAMLLKKNLVKKLIGMTIFQAAIIMFFVASASKKDATIPVVDTTIPFTDPALYINPLPHTLMLTAIVVGVATTGVAFALLMAIHRRYGTYEEPELLERMMR
jgi:multicomponent Na+:H+ antiporter subunit C